MISVEQATKDALRSGTYRKNWRFEVLGERGEVDFVIDNDTLVRESVIIDERVCSSDTLKFGLCEGASLEFQYFDHPNITGRRVRASIEAFRASGSEVIPMGFYTVDSCARQASTGIIKAMCYNKLAADYLDKKGNSILEEQFDNKDGAIIVRDIKNVLLEEYEVKDEAAEYVPIPVAANINMLGIYGTSFQFSALRVDVTDHEQPFNAYAAGVTATTANRFYCVWSDVFNALLDPSKVYRFSTSGGYYLTLIDSVTQTIYDYIEDTLVNSKVSTTANGVKNLLNSGACNIYDMSGGGTGTAAGTGNGLAAMMYAYVHYANGTTDYYSNVGFANDKTKYKGTFRDLVRKTIYGADSIGFVIPSDLGLTTAATNRSNAQALVTLNTFLEGNEVQYEYRASTGGAVTTSYYEVPYNADLGAHVPYNVVGRFYTMATVDGYTPLDMKEVKISDVPEFTLREVASALYEPYCQFGKLDRVTDLFEPVNLASGSPLNITPDMYETLWADEGNVHSFRYLIITYKGANDEEKTLQRTVNEHGTDNYNMSNNWLFKSFEWKAEDVGKYADAMAAAMRDITWFPFELWCAGLPYVESGDEVSINLGGVDYKSYVLQRTLKGIHDLHDTYINGSLDIF